MKVRLHLLGKRTDCIATPRKDNGFNGQRREALRTLQTHAKDFTNRTVFSKESSNYQLAYEALEIFAER